MVGGHIGFGISDLVLSASICCYWAFFLKIELAQAMILDGYLLRLVQARRWRIFTFS